MVILFRSVTEARACATGLGIGMRSAFGAKADFAARPRGKPPVAFDPTRTYGARLRVQSWSLLELLEQRLRLLKVRRVETLGKPAVDRREEVAGFVALALVAPEAGEAGGGA